jgi:hypothetical protein
MPQFEVFKKRSKPRNGQPYVTIQRSGALSINTAAYEALDSPKAVELLYDQQERIMGIRPADAGSEFAYPIRGVRGSYVFSGIAFTHYYDIDTEVSRRWSAYLDDGVLCVDLKGEGTPLTTGAKAEPLMAVSG